jgi:hypothetical protein
MGHPRKHKTSINPTTGFSLPGETWAPLYNVEHYFVSSLGRVMRAYIFKPNTTNNGYSSLNTSKNGKQRKIGLHRAVWESFNGMIPPELMVNHKNGIKTDNRLENLELVTNRENIEHYKKNLLTYKGELVNTAKLTPDLVREIRERSESGISTAILMRDYGVVKSTINRIITRKNWSHI